jgi:hypothetical protein
VDAELQTRLAEKSIAERQQREAKREEREEGRKGVAKNKSSSARWRIKALC